MQRHVELLTAALVERVHVHVVYLVHVSGTRLAAAWTRSTSPLRFGDRFDVDYDIGAGSDPLDLSFDVLGDVVGAFQ